LQTAQDISDSPPSPAEPRRIAAVAPAWHAVVLVAGILALSAASASRFSSAHGAIHPLSTYVVTAVVEVLMLAWALLGLWLKRTPLRSLLGADFLKLRSLPLDLGIALLFWIGSLMVLGTLAVTWTVVDAAIHHRPLIPANGKPDAAQQRTMQTLVQLAPSNGEEMAAWVWLCVLAGFAEEAVFRGYLQRQFIAWGRGRAYVGVVFSALVFGAAHAYEGARAMFLITVFGVLFSLLVLFRRSLRPAMIAHSTQDLFVGILLAILKMHHVSLS